MALAIGLDQEKFTFRMVGAGQRKDRIRITAEWVLAQFEQFYREFLEVPYQAKTAFEQQHHSTSIWLSRYRLSLYSSYIHRMGAYLKAIQPNISIDASFLNQLEDHFWRMVEDRYESDVAYAFMHSIRRMVYRDEWKPVEYSFWGSAQSADEYPDELLKQFDGNGEVTPALLQQILQVPDFSTRYRDIEKDSAAICARINRFAARRHLRVGTIEMVDAGFFRNRGAYLVGRIRFDDGSFTPLMIALLNCDEGVYCDAVILDQNLAHNLFSSTLANFHVTTRFYHELSAYLHSLMPHRALGLHYSTIGYNHVGKVAVMKELKQELENTGGVLDTAIGEPGTVAIGFSGSASAYNLKVIRNHPTEGYKWGEFEGIDSVKAKYSRVHEINRTGSMLDNIIYFNIALEQRLFSPQLLEELLSEASDTVSLQRGNVVFKYLIVQPRMTPLPVFLENADEREVRYVIENLGDCIKNNAAANIFNKDLDARNYGVSHFLKVYLFDYDALEDFLEVKVRSNLDRIDGEEDIPDWYFEDGVIFLPEEIEAGLCIRNREQRMLFRQMHGDLYSTGYWENLQQELGQNQVPAIKVYPDSCRLHTT
ncbi:MAG: bifunctional isocitrate dehydrogenase kinase/phosphatase [Gammaproteobacteria bacterium]|nr:MAG: bifunctional isocitrate dehydrogenase kinase/phosphatase [Gammaproteobacteria bacterium]UCH39347.1 MAG: bifunctional isocitrate dehydrogenase kinase/phosphatase [Gammaproteobacteria bacterium]